MHRGAVRHPRWSRPKVRGRRYRGRLSNTYRDPHAGLRSQIATKRLATADLSRRLTRVRRALLDAEARERIKSIATLLGEEELHELGKLSFDELVKLDGELDALESAITSAIAYTDVLLSSPGAVDLAFPGREITEPPAKWVLDARAIYAEIIEDDAFERLGNEGWMALFDDDGAFLFGCDACSTDINEVLELSHVACSLVCPFPSRIPNFVIGPVQGDIVDYRGRLGMKKNALKRTRFEHVCRYGGESPEMAEAFFPPKSKTRDLYLELDERGALEPPSQRRHPFLIAGSGHVQIGWSHDLKEDAEDLFDIALRLLKMLQKEAVR